MEIRSGIPEIHLQFWNNMTVRDLYSIYKAIHASPAKVLALLDDDVCLANDNQERVYGYLQQYIGKMKYVIF